MPHHSVRQSLLDLLRTHHVLSAPQLLELLHAQGQQVNKTSVYRALEKLQTDNLICKHNLSNNDLVYELREHHHDHLVCENCGKVEVTDCKLEVPVMQNGFSIKHHHLTLFGLCASCQT